MTPFLQLTPEVAARIVGERRYGHVRDIPWRDQWDEWNLIVEGQKQRALFLRQQMLNAVTDK